MSQSVIRAKFRVHWTEAHKDREGNQIAEVVKLSAVYGPDGSDNAGWSKATPSASLDMWISNPAAFGVLAPGQEFYVDFTPAAQ